MSDLDVSLRLRLIDQLSRPAEGAEKQLKQLDDVAQRLGRTRGGKELAGGLEKVGREADQAKGKLSALDKEADELRRAIGRIDDGRALTGLKTDANAAKTAFNAVETEADQVRRAIGRVDDGAFSGLKGDADRAERALNDVETEADQVRRAIGRVDDSRSLDNLTADAKKAERAIDQVGKAATTAGSRIDRLDNGSIRDRVGGHPRSRRGRRALFNAYEGAGFDAWLPFGGGVGLAAGVGTAAGVMAGARAYKHFASIERDMSLAGEAAGIGPEKTRADTSQIRDIAQKESLPVRDAFAGFKTLIASGLSWDDALAMMPNVAQTSMASGAFSPDIAGTFAAVQRSLGVKTGDLGKASDIMVAGGNAGMFELKDMAQYLPSLAPLVAQQGWKGLPGLNKLVALLQTVRNQTGTSGEADTAVADLFAKMNSPTLWTNFDKFGIDFQARMSKARETGADPLETLLNAVKEAIGDDYARLPELFMEKNSRTAVQAALTQPGKMEAYEKELNTSEGATEHAANRMNSDTQASLDRLNNSSKRAAAAIGMALDKIGVTAGNNFVAGQVDNAVQDPSSLFKWLVLTPIGEALLSGAGKVGGKISATAGEFLSPKDDAQGEAYKKVQPQAKPVQNPFPAIAPIPTPRPDGAEAAKRSMDGFNRELKKGGDAAEDEARRIRDELTNTLGFTARPTIAPTYRDPAPASSSESRSKAGSGKQSSVAREGGTVKITQHITSPNPTTAARKVQREQNRSVRHAQARALSDLGTKWA